MSFSRLAPSLLAVGALSAGLALLGAALHPVPPVHASSRDDRTAGHVLFNEKGCAHCHGTDGVGGERGPVLLGVGRKLKPDQIEHQITAGGGGMPAFADALTPAEIQDLVAWLKTQKKKSPKLTSGTGEPASAKPDPNAGSDDQK